MAALACDDVLFEPDGRFGMIVSIWAVGCSPNDARVRANIEAVCRFAALTNRPQESLLRFAGIEIGPSATPADMGFVWRDEMFGEGVAARFSSDLVLPVITPATLLEHGLDVGTAATFTELERALGLDACLWSFEIGERIMTEWADTVTRTEREVVCLLGDFYLLLVQYEEATTTLERARLRDELGEYLAEAEAWITTAPDLAARHGLRHDVLEMMRRVCSEDK
ncbi:MAG: hypothetical protein KAS72_09590 [Phycisphaerales bacterium]|nr:hypothetical protein [Phycisphaerales bacterium]